MRGSILQHPLISEYFLGGGGGMLVLLYISLYSWGVF